MQRTELLRLSNAQRINSNKIFQLAKVYSVARFPRIVMIEELFYISESYKVP